MFTSAAAASDDASAMTIATTVRMRPSYLRIRFDELDQLVRLTERQPRDRVRAAVVDRDAAGRRVAQRGAGEDHVRHVADALVVLARVQEIGLGAVKHLPRLVDVEQRGAEA